MQTSDRKTRPFHRLGNRGWSLLEVLIAAVIVGLTIPFAMSNFTSNMRTLDDTRISAAIDQLDENLANSVATNMMAFVRRIAYSGFRGNTACSPSSFLYTLRATKGNPLVPTTDPGTKSETLGVSGAAPGWATSPLVTTPALLLQAILNTKSTPSSRYLPPPNIATYDFTITPFNQVPTITSAAKVGDGDLRLKAQLRCAGVQDSDTKGLFFQSLPPPGQTMGKRPPPFTFGDDVGIYFCANIMTRGTGYSASGSVNATTNRTSLENMNLFGEFYFVLRNPTGGPPPTGNYWTGGTCNPNKAHPSYALIKSNVPSPPLPPVPPPPSDVICCNQWAANLAAKNSSRLGVLFYTLYWQAPEAPNQMPINKSYSGQILVTDSSTEAF